MQMSNLAYFLIDEKSVDQYTQQDEAWTGKSWTLRES